MRTLFVAGVNTDRCVSTTVRMGANLRVVGAREAGGGGTIWLVQDAVANFERGMWDAETVHAVNAASLPESEFAEVASTEEVVVWLSAGLKASLRERPNILQKYLTSRMTSALSPRQRCKQRQNLHLHFS